MEEEIKWCLEQAAALLQALIAADLFVRYFSCREGIEKWKAYLVLTGGYAATGVVFGDLFPNVWLQSISGIFCLFLVGLYALEGKWGEKLFLAVFQNLCTLLCALLTYGGLAAFFQKVPAQGLYYGEVEVGIRLIVLGIGNFLFFFCTRILLLKKHRGKLRATELLLVLGMAVMALLCGGFSYQSLIYSGTNQNQGIIVCALLSFTAALYFFFQRMNEDKEKLEEMERIKGQIFYQEKSITQIRQQYEEILRLRHDMKNHLWELRGILEQEGTMAGLSYLDSLEKEKIGVLTPFCRTGDPAVDAVVNAKLSLAAGRGIEVQCFWGGEETGTRGLGIMLGNLLDNSLEACQRLEEPWITLETGNQEGYWYCKIENSWDGYHEGDLSLQTTKADKKYHGYGIKSVKKMAEEQGGMLDLYGKPGRFTAKLYLKKIS